MAKDDVVVVLIVRSASGRTISGDTLITAANIAEFQPAADDVRVVDGELRGAGLQVGPAVGPSMTAAGVRDAVERLFGVHVETGPDGAFVVTSDGRRRRELPLDSLPPPLRERLTAATFEPPAELTGAGP